MSSSSGSTGGELGCLHHSQQLAQREIKIEQIRTGAARGRASDTLTEIPLVDRGERPVALAGRERRNVTCGASDV